MGTSLWISCLFHLLSLSVQSLLQNPKQYVPLAARDIELRVEKIHGSALPFQPIRFRATLRNISNRTLGPMRPIEANFLLELQAQGERQFRPVQDMTAIDLPNGVGSRRYPLPGMILAPGEQNSVSFVLALRSNPDVDSQDILKKYCSLFSTPGKRHLKFRYVIDQQPNGEVFHDAFASFDVQEPKGEDKDACFFLRKSPMLAAALLFTDRPAHLDVLDLVGLADSLPNSAYRPYARFALARQVLCSNGDDVRYEMRHAAGLRILNQLANEDFPCRPGVLRYLADYHQRLGNDAMDDYHERLMQQHPDALEWMPFYMGIIHARRLKEKQNRNTPEDMRDILFRIPLVTENEWREFRKRPAIPQKSKEPDRQEKK